MNKEYSLSEILICMVLDEAVIVFATVPGDTTSSFSTGCEKSDLK